jgi:hypothetical protein
VLKKHAYLDEVRIFLRQTLISISTWSIRISCGTDEEREQDAFYA